MVVKWLNTAGKTSRIVRRNTIRDVCCHPGYCYRFESYPRNQRVLVTLSKNFQGRVVDTLTTQKTLWQDASRKERHTEYKFACQVIFLFWGKMFRWYRIVKANDVQGRKARKPLRAGRKLPDMSCWQRFGETRSPPCESAAKRRDTAVNTSSPCDGILI